MINSVKTPKMLNHPKQFSLAKSLHSVYWTDDVAVTN